MSLVRGNVHAPPSYGSTRARKPRPVSAASPIPQARARQQIAARTGLTIPASLRRLEHSGSTSRNLPHLTSPSRPQALCGLRHGDRRSQQAEGGTFAMICL